ncbi:SDR family NAD(P)-dependent oxidoreductase [Mycobacterium angelicum]|nr:SDR family NAD(P)-dependent oxidoreductase [Mycobacterium angelicum]
MTGLQGKIALVTGASSGLGAATARLLSLRGATVFGVARDTEKLAAVFAGVDNGAYVSTDITSPQACVAMLAAGTPFLHTVWPICG